MIAVLDYFISGTMAEDSAEAKRMIARSSELTMIAGVLYNMWIAEVHS